MQSNPVSTKVIQGLSQMKDLMRQTGQPPSKEGFAGHQWTQAQFDSFINKNSALKTYFQNLCRQSNETPQSLTNETLLKRLSEIHKTDNGSGGNAFTEWDIAAHFAQVQGANQSPESGKTSDSKSSDLTNATKDLDMEIDTFDKHKKQYNMRGKSKFEDTKEGRLAQDIINSIDVNKSESQITENQQNQLTQYLQELRSKPKTQQSQALIAALETVEIALSKASTVESLAEIITYSK